MEENNVVNEREIRFFTPRFYAFDSFSAYTVQIWDKEFPTAEHAYQWKKYNETHPELAKQILEAKNPNAVKKISDANKDKVSPDWTEKKVAIMEDIVRAKVQQHEKVRKLLEESETRTIIENSPDDDFWGIGPNADGQNMLGKIWMRLREELRSGTTGA